MIFKNGGGEDPALYWVTLWLISSGSFIIVWTRPLGEQSEGPNQMALAEASLLAGSPFF